MLTVKGEVADLNPPPLVCACLCVVPFAGRRVRFDLDYTAPYPRLTLIRMPQPRARRRRPRAGTHYLTQLLLAHTHESAPVSRHLSCSPCALRRCHASSSSSRRITQRSPPSLDSSCARQRHASPRGRTSRRRCGSLRATDRTTRHSVPTSFRCVRLPLTTALSTHPPTPHTRVI